MIQNKIMLFGLLIILLVSSCTPQSIQNDNQVECKVDGDCVRAGCSSQLCVSKNAEPIFTTCEYKAEYACYGLTNCACINNKCAWQENQEFLDCLENPPELG